MNKALPKVLVIDPNKKDKIDFLKRFKKTRKFRKKIKIICFSYFSKKHKKNSHCNCNDNLNKYKIDSLISCIETYLLHYK